MTDKMTYHFVFLHLGEPRVPLFAGLRAPWEKVGPLVKRVIEGDVDSNNCGSCWRPVQAQDPNTASAFLIQLGYDENGNWVNVKGWACCQKCSRLSNMELTSKLCALIDAKSSPTEPLSTKP
jgi:hypothetical protein